jgi:hypothetical protein
MVHDSLHIVKTFKGRRNVKSEHWKGTGKRGILKIIRVEKGAHATWTRDISPGPGVVGGDAFNPYI